MAQARKTNRYLQASSGICRHHQVSAGIFRYLPVSSDICRCEPPLNKIMTCHKEYTESLPAPPGPMMPAGFSKAWPKKPRSVSLWPGLAGLKACRLSAGRPGRLRTLVKSLSLRILDRYEGHISATILWRKKIRKTDWGGRARN